MKKKISTSNWDIIWNEMLNFYCCQYLCVCVSVNEVNQWMNEWNEQFTDFVWVCDFFCLLDGSKSMRCHRVENVTKRHTQRQAAEKAAPKFCMHEMALNVKSSQHIDTLQAQCIYYTPITIVLRILNFVFCVDARVFVFGFFFRADWLVCVCVTLFLRSIHSVHCAR